MNRVVRRVSLLGFHPLFIVGVIEANKIECASYTYSEAVKIVYNACQNAVNQTEDDPEVEEERSAFK